MGKGIDAAREFSKEHTDLLDDLKDQLLIVFLKRLGGRVEIPIAEVDDTTQDMLVFRLLLGHKSFLFEIKKKS